MNGLSILGLFLVVYAFAVIAIAIKKPSAIWDMKKIQLFIKVLGEKGTVIFFYLFAAAAFAGGLWLLIANKPS